MISYEQFEHQSLSAELLNNLNNFLNTQKISINTFDAFAVCNGPGGYTSLRVAISTIKGIAASLDKRVQGVSKLAANAYACMQTQNEFSEVISFHRVRESYYIWTVYNNDKMIEKESADNFIEFGKDSINKFPSKAIICGDVPEELKIAIDNKSMGAQYKINNTYTKDARTIGELAMKRNTFYNANSLNVLYPLPPKIHKKN